MYKEREGRRDGRRNEGTDKRMTKGMVEWTDRVLGGETEGQIERWLEGLRYVGTDCRMNRHMDG